MTAPAPDGSYPLLREATCRRPSSGGLRADKPSSTHRALRPGYEVFASFLFTVYHNEGLVSHLRAMQQMPAAAPIESNPVDVPHPKTDDASDISSPRPSL